MDSSTRRTKMVNEWDMGQDGVEEMSQSSKVERLCWRKKCRFLDSYSDM